MAWIHYLVGAFFALAGGVCVLLVLLQLPGTWVLLGMALLIELCDGLYLPEGQETFGWGTLGVVLALGIAGELIEFVAGVVGVKRGGGSSRGMWGSLVGGLLGFFLLGPLFAFLPLFGVFLAVLIGTFVGAFLGEYTGANKRADPSERGRAEVALRPALWATIGRVLGTTGKVAIAMVMWLALVIRVLWH